MTVCVTCGIDKPPDAFWEVVTRSGERHRRADCRKCVDKPIWRGIAKRRKQMLAALLRQPCSLCGIDLGKHNRDIMHVHHTDDFGQALAQRPTL